MGFVRMYNADTDAYWDAPEESVTHWSSLGWTVADDDVAGEQPKKSAGREEWAAYAERLGLPTVDEDGNDLSRAALQTAVKDAAPASRESSPLGGDA